MKKILLIEDEEPIRRVLIRILEEENKDYEITECEDGKLGLNRLKKEDFDLVLCDIKMPKMDGVRFCKKPEKAVSTSHL